MTVSYVFGTDHLEHFFNQIAELLSTDTVISVLINFFKYIVDLLTSRVVNSDLFCDLDEHLFELTSLEETTAVDVDLAESVLHEFFHSLCVLHELFELFVASHSIQ